MVDVLTTVCAVFTLVGAKLLYWNNQSVTLGSVVLTALISASTAHLLSTGNTSDTATDMLNKVINTTCSFQDYAIPLRLACAFLQSNAPNPSNPPGRFSEQ